MNQKSYNNNIGAFLELVRSGLWGAGNPDIRIDGTTDWNDVYKLSQEQSVQGLVLQGIEEQRAKNLELRVPKVLLLQWIGEVQMLEQRNKDMNVFVADLIEKLRNYDVYTLLVKGQGIAQCYEKPLWRSCGDVDLLLSDENYHKAKKFLTPLASSVESEWGYQKHLSMTILETFGTSDQGRADQWVVELHGTLRTQLSAKVDRLIDQTQKAVFYDGQVRSWMNGKTQVFLPSADNDVIFIFTHFLKHFYKGGLGLRQICDWCRLLWIYRESLNQELLESRIRKAGLMSEWKAFGAFAVEVLGMSEEAMPMYSPADRWKRKAKRIKNFILMSGNMGHRRGSWLMEHDSWFARQYVVKKAFSMGRRIGDVVNHARIFPLDSIRFLNSIVFHGIRDAMRGE